MIGLLLCYKEASIWADATCTFMYPAAKKKGMVNKDPKQEERRGHFEPIRGNTLEYGRDLWCLELAEELRPILYLTWTIIGGKGHFKKILWLRAEAQWD